MHDMTDQMLDISFRSGEQIDRMLRILLCPLLVDVLADSVYSELQICPIDRLMIVHLILPLLHSYRH
jgi:hypothetical protein